MLKPCQGVDGLGVAWSVKATPLDGVERKCFWDRSLPSGTAVRDSDKYRIGWCKDAGEQCEAIINANRDGDILAQAASLLAERLQEIAIESGVVSMVADGEPRSMGAAE